MTDEQLLRYSRHILLDDIGIEGQARISTSRILIVGAGGLASPAALYLAAAGVGHLHIVDHDQVDLTNLQRQIAHTTSHVGQPKVMSIAAAIRAINPTIKITPHNQRADTALLQSLLPQVDVVLDCTDNFPTRQLINAACVAHRKILISGSAIRWDGQLSVYDNTKSASPCYACVFPPSDSFEETACSMLGVAGPLVGMVGTLQALEALKIVSGMGSHLVGRLLMIDGKNLSINEVRIQKNPHCPVCAANPLPAINQFIAR